MISPLAHGLLTGVLAAAVLVLMPALVRKPAGLPGKLSLRLMNIRHSSVTDWGLGHVRIEPPFTILDVGCGGGRTVDKLAAMASEGSVSGIDISAQSVAVSRTTNAKWIDAGRVDIQQASVSKLPFSDARFDLATAVETHYYWPDLVADLREVLRVLKPGGRLVLIAETYKGRSLDAIYQPAMKLLGATYLTPEEHRAALSAAGFSEVAVDVERRKGWICCVGRKPASRVA